jgi:hypothetical protein
MSTTEINQGTLIATSAAGGNEDGRKDRREDRGRGGRRGSNVCISHSIICIMYSKSNPY